MSVRTKLRTSASTVFPSGTRRGDLVRRLAALKPGPQKLLNRYATSHEYVFFVQIGSYNGRTGDPLYRHIERSPKWRGVMVEPNPLHFKALEELRGNDARFRLVQAAVTDHDGTVELTTVHVTDGMPEWADQLTSIDPNVVLAHENAVEGLRDRIATVTVPAITFETLTAELDRIDLLHIDTEGHDAAILDQVDLTSWKPDVVLFEHKHLATSDYDRCRQRLARSGYRCWSDNFDTIAIRRGLPNARRRPPRSG